MFWEEGFVRGEVHEMAVLEKEEQSMRTWIWGFVLLCIHPSGSGLVIFPWLT